MWALAITLGACGGATPLHVDGDADADADSDADCDPAPWPCRLTGPQCGCHDGERCTLDVDGLRICSPSAGAGGPSEGAPCGADGLDDCVDGMICAAASAQDGFCRRFCEDDVDCTGDGGTCAIPITAGGTPVPDALLCSLDCDPRSGSGCQGGTTCQVAASEEGASYFTDCSEVEGPGVQEDACDRVLGPHCGRGFSCVENVCRHFCEDPGGMAAGCSDYQRCVGFDPPAIIGPTEYGVCQ